MKIFMEIYLHVSTHWPSNRKWLKTLSNIVSDNLSPKSDFPLNRLTCLPFELCWFGGQHTEFKLHHRFGPQPVDLVVILVACYDDAQQVPLVCSYAECCITYERAKPAQIRSTRRVDRKNANKKHSDPVCAVLGLRTLKSDWPTRRVVQTVNYIRSLWDLM